MSDVAESSGTAEEEYEVESIVGDRKRQGVQEFFVKWKGFPKSQNTWAAIEDLEGAHDLVNEYVATKLGRADAAIRRKPVVRSDPDLVRAKSPKLKAKVKAAKPAKAKVDDDEEVEDDEKGGQVERVVGVVKTGGHLVFQAKTVDGSEVTLSRSALRAQNPSALLEFIETLLNE
jgi:hypothetical protein